MNTNPLGQAIKYYRHQKNLTQEELARHAGMCYNTLIKIERCNRRANPTIDILQQIAKPLDIQVQALLDFKSVSCIPRETHAL